MTEFWPVMKANWMPLTISAMLLGGVYFVYPFTPMGKAQLAEIEKVNRGNAIQLFQLGMLDEEDKAWYYAHYGWTEEDYDPAKLLENSN